MLKASARSSSSVISASQTCHLWLWKAMLCIWGTLLSGIVVEIVANLNTTATDALRSELFITHLALAFPVPVFSSLGLLVLLTLLAWIGSHEHPARLPRALSHWDRTQMLRRLRLRYEQM